MIKEIKLLIIDDNTDDRELYKRTLSARPLDKFEYTELDSGQSILDETQEMNFDCILLDYSLPGHDGIHILKKIRNTYPFLPIIMLTGQGNEDIAVQAMKHGAQDYVIKSNISSDKIFYTISLAIDSCDMRKRVKEQQETLKLFSHAMAHDLKAPLRTIISFCGLAEESPEEFEDFIKVIKGAASNMEMFVHSFLNFTKFTYTDEVYLEDCNLNKVVQGVLNNLKIEINSKNVKINLPDLPNVIASESHITQAIQNLIGNAIQYNDKENPEITLTILDLKNHYKVTIKDNGPGIKSTDLEEIFKPFKRFSAQAISGSGLGLAITKKIIESHKGKIWCESLVNRETLFHFTLLKCTDSV